MSKYKTASADLPINIGILFVWLFHMENPAKWIIVYVVLNSARGERFVNEKSTKLLDVKGSDANLIRTAILGKSNVRSKVI